MSLEETTALYAEVKAWIAQQEAFEKATRTPARLTNAQRKALETLRVPLSVTPPPELGDMDYVSLLHRYRQANPTSEDLKWEEEEASTKAIGGAVGRICRVTISESPDHAEAPVESFPAVGHGVQKDEDPPVFPKKKDAKQYAAKCAIEWLIAQSYMPSNLKDVTFPKGHGTSRPALSSSFIRGPTEDFNRVTTPPPERPAKGTSGAVDFRDESLPATQRVSALCRELGLPQPKYVLTRSTPGTDRYFNGKPDFGHENSMMPAGLGHVEHMEGVDKTKSAIASLVLEYLLQEHQERQSLLEDLPATSEGAAL
ncbi:hypothetical protein VMCG_00440 [Cytospora schulzeri]|uniref:DRBM domain-containing protein n=1 Tax=Cytospora schulzeri TaxID=448051 RepID=A0A423X8B0_9PEZI|nr:hypothetical protein VMCG_00440 [Valsa malicola]